MYHLGIEFGDYVVEAYDSVYNEANHETRQVAEYPDGPIGALLLLRDLHHREDQLTYCQAHKRHVRPLRKVRQVVPQCVRSKHCHHLRKAMAQAHKFYFCML